MMIAARLDHEMWLVDYGDGPVLIPPIVMSRYRGWITHPKILAVLDPGTEITLCDPAMLCFPDGDNGNG